ncbi:hypothetical protein [Sinomicrobium weinanense]|uniref:hypothetical protein n=1 Tax=Sinomicrobium weinanense TaxID=2842200 RepID=UPI0031EC437E
MKLPRSKYLKWKKRYIGYSKRRKKTVKKRRSLTRALLRLLDKFLSFEKQLLKGQITKERASRLEGSFGKEKEHYHLKKVKAKTRDTEIPWIFFGIHTANCLEIGRRMAGQLHRQAA